MLCGDPSIWLKHVRGIHDKVLQSIIDVWPNCANRFNATSSENKMTDQLALDLRQHPHVRNLFRIESQYKLLDASAFNGDVVTKGYIDFVVIFDLNQDHYLAYECKRLNATFPSGSRTLADKYVDEGLMRYVSAQYAQEMPFATMIGYVLDGDLSKALSEVTSQIQKKKNKLLCTKHYPTQFDIVGCTSIFWSHHKRKQTLIEVQHLLLPVSSCRNRTLI